MHNVSNVEREDPIIGREILNSKSTASCDLKSLLNLKFVHLFEGLEGNLKLFLLGHTVLEVISPIFEIQFTDLRKLSLDLYQFIYTFISLLNLLLENLNFLRHVLTTASIRGG